MFDPNIYVYYVMSCVSYVTLCVYYVTLRVMYHLIMYIEYITLNFWGLLTFL